MSGSLDLEPGPVAVGLVVGIGGLLFLLEPVVAPLSAAGLVVRPVALSAVTLAVGFWLGALVFARRGRRLFALAHAVFGLAWTGLVAGTLLGAGVLVIAAVVLVVAGVGFLVGQRRQSGA